MQVEPHILHLKLHARYALLKRRYPKLTLLTQTIEGSITKADECHILIY